MAARVLGLLSTVIVARILAPEDYGIIAACMIVQDYAARMQKFGIYQNLITSKILDVNTVNAAFIVNASFGILASLVVYLLSSAAAGFLNNDNVRPVLELICWTFLINGFCNIGLMLEAKKQNFLPEAWTTVLSKIISVIVTVALAIYLTNYWALAIGMVVSDIAFVLLSYFFAKPFLPKLMIDVGRIKDLFRFSRWIFLYENVDFWNAKLFQLVVAKLFDVKYLGFFSLGSSLSFMYVSEVSSSIDKSNLSHLSEELEKQDSDKRKAEIILKDLNYVFDLKHVIITPVYIVLATYPELFISLILGEQWLEMAPFVTAFALIMMVTGYNYSLINLHTTLRQPRYCFNSSVIRLVSRAPIIYVAYLYESVIILAYGGVVVGVIGAIYLLVKLYARVDWVHDKYFVTVSLYQVLKVVGCVSMMQLDMLSGWGGAVVLIASLFLLLYLEFRMFRSQAYSDLHEYVIRALRLALIR